jgi:hypothetical protein
MTVSPDGAPVAAKTGSVDALSFHESRVAMARASLVPGGKRFDTRVPSGRVIVTL